MTEIIMVICMTSFGPIKGKVLDFEAGGVYNTNTSVDFWQIEETDTKDVYNINSNDCLKDD